MLRGAVGAVGAWGSGRACRRGPRGRGEHRRLLAAQAGGRLVRVPRGGGLRAPRLPAGAPRGLGEAASTPRRGTRRADPARPRAQPPALPARRRYNASTHASELDYFTDLLYRAKLAPHREQLLKLLGKGIPTILLANKLDTVTASKAKLLVTELQCRTADECLQLHGGWGYMWEYQVCRAFADARVQRIYAGSNEIMKLIIARGLFK